MRRALLAVALALFVLGGCGPAPRGIGTSSPATSASPVPTPASTATATASAPPAPSPTPVVVRAGAPAWVAVSVATEWRSPSSPRPVDAPALAAPAALREWLAGLSPADQAGLIDRADSQVLLGDRVDVTAVSGSWVQVVVPDQATPLDARGYPGWIPLAQLSALEPPASGSIATVTDPTTWLLRGGLPVVEVAFGTRLPVVDQAASIVRVGLPGGEVLDAPTSAVTITPAGTPARGSAGAAVVATARLFLGVRYLWAGTSAFGFDCSGLVYNVFRVHGVTLPRDAQDQALVGTAVARQNLQPGDLVFLARGGVVHHVAIYIGSGTLLDSPDLGRGVQIVSMAAEPYASEFSGARRVLA
ncbi:MAG TPA: C40 family peptidase [Candidatus Dormibacteraeota bacterium]|nr:C40 family peptidase [Candidatus Dormibacteraeota bacterium]